MTSLHWSAAWLFLLWACVDNVFIEAASLPVMFTAEFLLNMVFFLLQNITAYLTTFHIDGGQANNCITSHLRVKYWADCQAGPRHCSPDMRLAAGWLLSIVVPLATTWSATVPTTYQGKIHGHARSQISIGYTSMLISFVILSTSLFCQFWVICFLV